MSENGGSKEKNDTQDQVHNIDDTEGSLEDFAAQSDKSASAEDENQSEGSEAEEELNKLKNDFLYLKAEFDNYKKRVIKERSDLIKYGGERIFNEILDVADNFERALSSDLKEGSLEQYQQGVEMIYKSLMETLKRLGVQEVPSLGEDFDPNKHEALGAEPSEKFKPGQISQVIKKPYILHDKVIRPGQVIVAKEPVSEDNSDE